MKTLRTSGLEQLEPRAMLAAFGPPGVHFEFRLAQPPPAAEIDRGPSLFDAAASVRGYDFHPQSQQLLFIFQIVVVPAPATQVTSAAVWSPRSPAEANAAPVDRGEGEGTSSSLRAAAPSSAASLLAISLSSELVSRTSTPISSSPWNTADQPAASSRELVSTATPVRATTNLAERKPLGVFKRSAAEPGESEGQSPLAAIPARGKRKAAIDGAPVSGEPSLANEFAAAAPMDLPNPWNPRLPAAKPLVLPPGADDGLIELLAADLGTIQSVAVLRPAEAVQLPPPAPVALEMATAADAIAEDSAVPSSEAAEKVALPAVPLH